MAVVVMPAPLLYPLPPVQVLLVGTIIPPQLPVSLQAQVILRLVSQPILLTMLKLQTELVNLQEQLSPLQLIQPQPSALPMAVVAMPAPLLYPLPPVQVLLVGTVLPPQLPVSPQAQVILRLVLLLIPLIMLRLQTEAVLQQERQL